MDGFKSLGFGIVKKRIFGAVLSDFGVLYYKFPGQPQQFIACFMNLYQPYKKYDRP